MSTSHKRHLSDENSAPINFIQYTQPSVKRVRRQVLKDITPAQREAAHHTYLTKQKERVDQQQRQLKEAEEEKEKLEAERLRQMELARVAAGYPTLYSFLSSLLATKDRQISSQVSQMLSRHVPELINLMHARQPEEIDIWMANRLKALLVEEGHGLTMVLKPDRAEGLTSVLETFSLPALLCSARGVAPQSFALLSELSGYSEDGVEGRKK